MIPSSEIISLRFLRICLAALAGACAMNLATTEAKQSIDPAIAQGDYRVTVKNDLISLRAENASLKAVLKEVGRQTAVQVIPQIPASETVTISFEKLPLEDAIDALTDRSIVITDVVGGDHKITKIVVLPEGNKSSTRLTGNLTRELGARPEPFRFEFNPTEIKQGSAAQE